MKKNLVIPVCMLLMIGMLTASGCVPKADLDKALDLNRKCRAQLQAEMAKNQSRALAEQQLQDQLAIAQAQARKAEGDVASITAARDDLQTRFTELSGKFEDLLKKNDTPPPVGDFLLPVQVNKALQAFARANPGLVEYDPRHGMVKIKSDLTFELGSTTAKASAVEALTKLVTIINDPAIAKYHVYIAGHTDNVPITRPTTKKRHPDNWYLSVHRAVAIKKVMQKAGLAPVRIGVMGFGEYHPVAANAVSTTTGKKRGNKLNRRVEIWIVPPDRFLTSSVSGGGAEPVDEK
ncbi:MAG: OmpA family protein [Phycisphaerae bacterium]|jgi:chemotaxis protein MotB|nr:OmpA family protein [Phycisphaerae bacterium]